jgi:hypothetical protein
MDTRRLERAEVAKNRKREKELRLQALAEASALPRLEAEQSIQRRIQDAVQPLLAKISSIEEQLQGNGSAPMYADIRGAAAKSGKESRQGTRDTNQDTSKETEAVSDTQRREKKRRRLLKVVRHGAEASTQSPPAEIRDQAKKQGLRQEDGGRKRRKKKGRAGKNPE